MDAVQLKSYPRREIQRLAKEHGIKANSKTEEIIKQLVAKQVEGGHRPDPEITAVSSISAQAARVAGRRRSMRIEARLSAASTLTDDVDVDLYTSTTSQSITEPSLREAELPGEEIRPPVFSLEPKQPLAGPSRQPAVQYTPKGTHIITDDPNQPIRARVFYQPDDPNRPSARRRNRPGPTRKEGRTFLRECARLADEDQAMREQLQELRDITILARERIDDAEERLQRVRKIRGLVERHFMSKLKEDETLHDGSKQWQKPTRAGEQQDQAFKPIIPQWTGDVSDVDDDSDEITVEEDDSSSSSSPQTSGKRKRGSEEEEPAPQAYRRRS